MSRIQPNTEELCAIIALLLAEARANKEEQGLYSGSLSRTFSRSELQHGKSMGASAVFNDDMQVEITFQS